MTITVKIDKFGKIFLPRNVRKKLNAEKFEIVIKDGVVELIPVKNPLALFGTLKSLDTGILDEIHGEDHEFDA
jgi:bifunctional DNA-binding transcriptional regulator/antitoxin component of YhaV-PrlF toxin-antitoxin module